MKRLFLSITAALLGLAASASAQTWSTVTPTYGGGYQFREYGPSGNSWGTMTPTYGGGYPIPGAQSLQHTEVDTGFRVSDIRLASGRDRHAQATRW